MTAVSDSQASLVALVRKPVQLGICDAISFAWADHPIYPARDLFGNDQAVVLVFTSESPRPILHGFCQRNLLMQKPCGRPPSSINIFGNPFPALPPSSLLEDRDAIN